MHYKYLLIASDLLKWVNTLPEKYKKMLLDLIDELVHSIESIKKVKFKAKVKKVSGFDGSINDVYILYI